MHILDHLFPKVISTMIQKMVSEIKMATVIDDIKQNHLSYNGWNDRHTKFSFYTYCIIKNVPLLKFTKDKENWRYHRPVFYEYTDEEYKILDEADFISDTESNCTSDGDYINPYIDTSDGD